MYKNFISLLEFSNKELNELLTLSMKIKKNPVYYGSSLLGKIIGLIFEKPSTRTRVSFEVGIMQLGGKSIFLNKNDLQLARNETIEDTAKVLSRYLDAIIIRSNDHLNILKLAKNASIPVINALSDFNHPCQALSDILTIKENFSDLNQVKVCYIGDGNNVSTSLLFACVKMGINIHLVSPKKYHLKENILKLILPDIRKNKVKVVQTEDWQKGVENAQVIYTDVWISMGQEKNNKIKIKDFQKYQITPQIMEKADKNAIFLHCLPAHRGIEVNDIVIDGPQSKVFDQAENKLYVQKAIMYNMMKK